MAFIRRIKKKGAVYLAEVESYREDGKVKQRVIRYLGKEVEGKPEKKIYASNVEVLSSRKHLDFFVLDHLARNLGLHQLLGVHSKYILMLVYTQLICRKAIYKLPQYIEETTLMEILGLQKLIDKHLYQALDWLESEDFGSIERCIFEKLSQEISNKDVLILDVTDTYFNGKNADWKKRKGKDGKNEKLIQIALAVTQQEGFPILHKTYEGNIGNSKIFSDLLLDIRLADFNCIILDRGMMSKKRLTELQALKQQVITGLRRSKKLQTEFIDKIKRSEIYHPENGVLLKNTHVFFKSFDYMNGKLIVIYNPQMETTKMESALKNPAKYNPDKAKYYGYSLLFHSTNLPDKDAIIKYFAKDVVEKAYRQIKTTINLNPIRKYRMDRIIAHVKICYLAYALLSYLSHKLKPLNLSAVDSLDILQSVHKVELSSKKDNLKWSKTVTLKNEQSLILKKLGCSV